MFAAVYCGAGDRPGDPRPRDRHRLRALVHGAQEFKWGPPVVAGDEITTEAERQGDGERGGLGFFVFESVSTNQRGEPVCEGHGRTSSEESER